jgi:site-specific DNA recombinase
VLEQLAEAQQGKADEGDRLADEIKRLDQAILAKANERDQVITWCRRGRISEADMDRQLDEIQAEEVGLKKELERLSGLARSAETASAQLKTAEQLLLDLNQKLDQPITWELKRQLVETLVEEIVVETLESNGKKEAIVHVSYRFGSPQSDTVKCQYPNLTSFGQI